jgi:hypothetical protein
MGPMNFHRLRGNWKAMSATLGVGVFVTMGAVSIADTTMEPGTPPDRWKADGHADSGDTCATLLRPEAHRRPMHLGRTARSRPRRLLGGLQA